MKGIAETIESVPMRTVDWHRRINLGCWSARYLPLRQRYLPRYAITLICWDVSYARQFLQVPRIAFSVNQKILIGPLGNGFLEEARAARRRVYVWTVNAPALMRWSIRHEIDGVITDHPDRFQAECKRWEEELTSDSPTKRDPAMDRLPLKQRVEILLVALYVVLFGWYYRKNFPAVERVQFEERKVE
jgi:phosphatidylglycerol phospholipase C